MSLRSIEYSLILETQHNLGSTEVLIDKTDVPLKDLLKIGLQTGKLDKAELVSHSMDPAYFGWQRVRLAGIPLDLRSPGQLVTCKTGLEGYFVGEVRSTEELATKLLQIGEDIWRGIRLMHKFSPQKRKRLEQAILGTGFSLESAVEWSTILGATLGRLRAKLLYNPDAQKFQSDTKQAVGGLPKIEYGVTQRDSGIVQVYKLPIKNADPLILSDFHSTDEQSLYWQTVQNLGLFGHPLVRALLRELYR